MSTEAKDNEAKKEAKPPLLPKIIVEKGEKDEVVLAILQEAGFQPKKPARKYPRFKKD